MTDLEQFLIWCAKAKVKPQRIGKGKLQYHYTLKKDLKLMVGRHQFRPVAFDISDAHFPRWSFDEKGCLFDKSKFVGVPWM